MSFDGFRIAGDFHGGGVPLEGLADADDQRTEQDSFRQRAGIAEVRTRLDAVADALASARQHIHFNHRMKNLRF